MKPETTTTDPRLFPERRLTRRWKQIAIGHQIKRKFILIGRFQTLRDKLTHERSEIAKRKFGPFPSGKPKSVPGRAAINSWSRRKSAWRIVS